MGLTLKHAAGLAGLIIVGVIAFFFVYLPDLIRDNHLTLAQGMWIGLALTIFSFVCFGIERVEAIKEEKEHERSEKEHYSVMKEILRRVQEMDRQKSTLSAHQLQKLSQAEGLYSALGESPSYASQVATRLTLIAVKKVLDTMIHSARNDRSDDAATEMLNAIFRKKLDRKKVRQAADLLVLSALGSEKDLPLN